MEKLRKPAAATTGTSDSRSVVGTQTRTDSATQMKAPPAPRATAAESDHRDERAASSPASTPSAEATDLMEGPEATPEVSMR